MPLTISGYADSSVSAVILMRQSNKQITTTPILADNTYYFSNLLPELYTIVFVPKPGFQSAAFTDIMPTSFGVDV